MGAGKVQVKELKMIETMYQINGYFHLNVFSVRNLSIIRMIDAPFPYEIRSKISLISSGCFTGMETGWELSRASIPKTS